ncbi:MAG: AlpA family phage regulatory protein [Chromatiaceae bacterium]|nr:AlpA family phage regulatory protein [Chromatiaceae bacterium]
MPKSINERYYRLTDIIGQRAITPEEAEANRKAGKRGRLPRPEIRPLIPISASAWWAGVKTGRYPKPVKLGERVTVWRARDIEALLNQREECREAA